jgi:signal transduction histidine kinase
MHSNLIQVLLVEDKPGDVELLQELLAQSKLSKFQVKWVRCLEKAINLLKVERFDAILLDLTLPDSIGLDTLKELQATLWDIPIVVLTDLDDEELAVEAVRQGAQDYLVKGQVTTELLVRSLRYGIERTLGELALRQSERREREKATQLELALYKLKHTQAKLVQSEKMSSLGLLIAGIAHEINNPLNFIYSNIIHAREYINDLLDLVQLYQKHYSHPASEIQAQHEAIDLEFLSEDLPQLLDSMKLGADRILQLVLSLRNFSRHDQIAPKLIDIHEGIENTLLLLQHRLKATDQHPTIEVVKEYGNLPLVEGYAGQLNQVFMNILSNAIDAVEEVRSNSHDSHNSTRSPRIRIRTSYSPNQRYTPQITSYEQPATGNVLIQIADNGSGIAEAVKARVFNPFFTTKPVGKGTGLGLSISYQIVVEKHKGTLGCESQLGEGTEFWIEIPVRQNQQPSAENAAVLNRRI